VAGALKAMPRRPRSAACFAPARVPECQMARLEYREIELFVDQPIQRVLECPRKNLCRETHRLGSAKLPSKNVFADTTILSEKEG